MELLVQIGLLLASAVCAVTPMVTLLGLVWWLDRYTREPIWIYGLTFLWGGIGGVLIALVGNTTIDALVGMLVRVVDPIVPADIGWIATAAGPVVIAPLIEEPSKAIFLLFVLWNRHFDNMNDGFVYGAAAGLGFGMTENFLYFAQTSQDPGTWMQTVMVRTAYSAVMHATSCSIVGAALAFGWFRGRGAFVLSGAVGLGIAMCVHAAWNGILTAGDLLARGDQALMLDLLVFPFEFLVVFGLFQLTLWDEGRTIRRELEEEAAAGRIPPGHPGHIASWWSRNFQRDWLPPRLDRAMYLESATSLAIRKSQLRLMGPRATPFYRDEVDRLRGQVQRVLDMARQKPAGEAVKS